MPRKKRYNLAGPITDVVDKKAFGKRVSDLMREQEYTNEMLAERIGVSTSSVIALKAGERLPGLDNYLRLLMAFDTCDLVLLQDSINDEALKNNEMINKQIIPLICNLEHKELELVYNIIKPLVCSLKNREE